MHQVFSDTLQNGLKTGTDNISWEASARVLCERKLPMRVFCCAVHVRGKNFTREYAGLMTRERGEKLMSLHEMQAIASAVLWRVFLSSFLKRFSVFGEREWRLRSLTRPGISLGYRCAHALHAFQKRFMQMNPVRRRQRKSERELSSLLNARGLPGSC